MRRRKQVKPGAALTFLGTRGEIDVKSRRHGRHSSLLIRRGKARIMVDCGTDWLGRIGRVQPTAIVLTHAHPDHAAGLARGAPCPVYATAETRKLLSNYPVARWRTVAARKAFTIGGVRLEAFPVEHSTRAPAVGYRIAAAGKRVFYVPDVVAIPERHRALAGVDLYIGDGATLHRPLVRRRGGALVGHTPVSTQLGWCGKEGVPLVLFTHCGTEIVRGDSPKLRRLVRELGRKHGIVARIAYDGLRLKLP